LCFPNLPNLPIFFSPSGTGTENGESSGAITEEVIQRTIDSLVRFLRQKMNFKRLKNF
jgi:hypothetical protein